MRIRYMMLLLCCCWLLTAGAIVNEAPSDMPADIAGLLSAPPHADWELTAWVLPQGADTGFVVLRQDERNLLLSFERHGGSWQPGFINEHALPQGDIIMRLSGASGSGVLIQEAYGEGDVPATYGRALSIYGEHEEYAIRHSIWEEDAAGRWMLSFYAHEGQSGMICFQEGRRCYPEIYGNIRWQRDDTQRDLALFDYRDLPDPCPQELSRQYEPVGAVVRTSDPRDRLNLRKAPDTEADMIGRYYSGTPVSVLEDDGGDWVKVWIGWDRKGYMMRRFLAFGAEGEQVGSAMPFYDMEDAWQLYYEPFQASHVKASYAGGQRIQVMGLMDGWWHVRLADQPDVIGFIPELEPL